MVRFEIYRYFLKLIEVALEALKLNGPRIMCILFELIYLNTVQLPLFIKKLFHMFSIYTAESLFIYFFLYILILCRIKPMYKPMEAYKVNSP